MHVLEADDPRLVKYRKAAEKIGDSEQEFMQWIDGIFESHAELEVREAALEAREEAALEREKAVAEREKALTTRISHLQSHLDAIGAQS
jgi:hypothetical protein